MALRLPFANLHGLLARSGVASATRSAALGECSTGTSRSFSTAAAVGTQPPAAAFPSSPSVFTRSDGSGASLALSGGGVYPPVRGGPVYWSLRRGWITLKRTVRRSNRALDFNWELGRTTFAGVPKFSYNPKANEWIYLIDNEEWNGVGGRVWISISMQILYFFHWAFWSYFLYYRVLVNGKLDVFGKWKDRVEESRGA